MQNQLIAETPNNNMPAIPLTPQLIAAAVAVNNLANALGIELPYHPTSIAILEQHGFIVDLCSGDVTFDKFGQVPAVTISDLAPYIINNPSWDALPH